MGWTGGEAARHATRCVRTGEEWFSWIGGPRKRWLTFCFLLKAIFLQDQVEYQPLRPGAPESYFLCILPRFFFVFFQSRRMIFSCAGGANTCKLPFPEKGGAPHVIEERNGRISFGTPSLKRAGWPLFCITIPYEPGAVPLRLLLPGAFLRKRAGPGRKMEIPGRGFQGTPSRPFLLYPSWNVGVEPTGSFSFTDG